ncbi:MAG: DeoR family transcriptional regulator, partial [Anaerolineales bacterium]|nr:DeoR family transcriptional regulator [Anaerolineales bacterium]
MMSNPPPLTLRQSQIISWLKDEEALSIKELVQRLEVSS